MTKGSRKNCILWSKRWGLSLSSGTKCASSYFFTQYLLAPLPINVFVWSNCIAVIPWHQTWCNNIITSICYPLKRFIIIIDPASILRTAWRKKLCLVMMIPPWNASSIRFILFVKMRRRRQKSTVWFISNVAKQQRSLMDGEDRSLM